MKRFLISLGAGFLVALCVYLGQALPYYEYLSAHQPGAAAMDEVTSNPPYVAFIWTMPYAALAGIIATALLWTVLTFFRR